MKNTSLLIAFFLISRICVSQEVLRAPKYADGVYTKEAAGIKSNLNRNNIFIPTYLFDTSRTAVAEVKINYYKQHLQEAPLIIEECVYFNPGQTDNTEKITHPDENKKRSQKPYSFLFYSDTLSYLKEDDKLSPYTSYLKLKKPLEDYYEPFYFKKTEVSNKEYREFVYWVIDSIARTLLMGDADIRYYTTTKNGDLILNKKTSINWADQNIREVLEPMYLAPEERFYKRREFDFRKINFTYSTNTCSKCMINVYPDTLSWVHDFPAWHSEPLTNMYFWHPAFNDYPVVGITQLQAKAFLIWKTQQKQEELDRQHSNYNISYELPSEAEWEMVATADVQNNQPVIYSPELTRLYDHNYITDITLRADTSFVLKEGKHAGESEYYDFEIYFHDLFADEMKKKPLNTTNIHFEDSYIPPYLYKTSLMYRKNHKSRDYPKDLIKTLQDENSICFMGSNVSEWMQDTYKDNWLPAYTYHQNKLKKINTPDVRLLIATEEYYNSKNALEGVLVRGGNWYDYSEAIAAGKNFDGINKKRFVDPNKAYCTVGFRYVVKVHRKDEDETIRKDQAAESLIKKEKK
ncbi:MAG TPA: SUMF1/EgtB/PvdO family nonheme iron enzyme [Bacteroidia bacterium]|jgi:formylglycine-generating enzyme required for sulfatase activity